MDTGINVNAIPCKISHVDEATIVYLVSIQPMANSYVGDAGVSILDPSKPKENFQFLPSENICDGVQFSIPCKENDRFQTISKKKKKGKSRTTTRFSLVLQIGLEQNVRYKPKAAREHCQTTRASNVGNTSKSSPSHMSSMSKNQPLKASFPTLSSRRSPINEEGGNITMSNSYDALDDDSEEEIENVYDELVNLFNSTKIGASLSTFTVAAC
ncbi:hypothetical protein Tco_1506742 [Tanacetum coccineum]